MDTSFEWQDIDSLITMLHAQGVCYLLGNGSSSHEEQDTTDPVALIQRLAACGYPLVENASISLFLLHPEFAPFIVEALQSSEEEIAETIAVLVLATLYLQQWWFFRLTFAFGRLPAFPEAPFAALWEERSLLAPNEGYGLSGLLALQTYQQQRYNVPLNFLDDWQKQIDHLLAQEEAAQRELPGEVRKVLVALSK